MAASSSNQEKSVHDELYDFREKWQRELRIVSPKNEGADEATCPINDSNQEKESCIEIQARRLFSEGTDLENNGKFYEAIQCYRKAIQLVPDIECKFYKFSDINREEKVGITKDDSKLKGTSSLDKHKFQKSDLLTRINRKMNNVSFICVPKFEQKSVHISALPVEILLYILRWVVSSQLDMRSLEMFGRVCRGFYLCARDSEIWRLACVKVWGAQCGNTPENYKSWRHMFLDRMRVRFNGCYISKTTYIRHGESSFQDQSYRPWHLVSYYRYLRFFPDGSVLMLTSANEPCICVSLLRYRNPRSPVLSGYYRIKDDKVSIVVYRPKNPASNNKQNINVEFASSQDQTIYIDFHIKNHKNKRHINLEWSHYSISFKSKVGDENVCVFDLDNKKFCPFWFSRVKSYTLESEEILS